MSSQKRKASSDAEDPDVSSSQGHLPASELSITPSGIQQGPTKRACSQNSVFESIDNFGMGAEINNDSGDHDAPNQSEQPTAHSLNATHSDLDEATPPLAQMSAASRERKIARTKALQEKIGFEAWRKIVEANTKTTAVTQLRVKESDRRNKLLPMTPGGRINLYTTYLPIDWVCRDMWNTQSQEVGAAFNAIFKSYFDGSSEFRVWPEPSDWDLFEKYPKTGMKNLGRARDFVVFWEWDYQDRIWEYTSNKASLKGCLEMFINGDDVRRYQDFLARPMTNHRS
ncbi:hypothetical protein ACHAQE_010667 [Botrytis cinerea]